MLEYENRDGWKTIGTRASTDDIALIDKAFAKWVKKQPRPWMVNRSDFIRAAVLEKARRVTARRAA